MKATPEDFQVWVDMSNNLNEIREGLPKLMLLSERMKRIDGQLKKLNPPATVKDYSDMERRLVSLENEIATLSRNVNKIINQI